MLMRRMRYVVPTDICSGAGVTLPLTSNGPDRGTNGA